jgi:hypothetical protein
VLQDRREAFSALHGDPSIFTFYVIGKNCDLPLPRIDNNGSCRAQVQTDRFMHIPIQEPAQGNGHVGQEWKEVIARCRYLLVEVIHVCDRRHRDETKKICDDSHNPMPSSDFAGKDPDGQLRWSVWPEFEMAWFLGPRYDALSSCCGAWCDFDAVTGHPHRVFLDAIVAFRDADAA